MLRKLNESEIQKKDDMMMSGACWRRVGHHACASLTVLFILLMIARYSLCALHLILWWCFSNGPRLFVCYYLSNLMRKMINDLMINYMMTNLIIWCTWAVVHRKTSYGGLFVTINSQLCMLHSSLENLHPDRKN